MGRLTLDGAHSAWYNFLGSTNRQGGRSNTREASNKDVALCERLPGWGAVNAPGEMLIRNGSSWSLSRRGVRANPTPEPRTLHRRTSGGFSLEHGAVR
jgi:hypothetical protein